MKRRKDMDFSSIVEELKKTADELLEKTDVDEKAVAKYKELKEKAEKELDEKFNVKEFHKFLFSEGITKTNPALHIESPKSSKPLPVVLTIEEVSKMIDSIDTSNAIGQRNKAMMETLYASGLRISELLDLRLSNIHLREKYIIVIGKGDKERMVPLGDMAVVALRKYIEEGRLELAKKKTDILFYN
jgi:integrase/recombinase XerD